MQQSLGGVEAHDISKLIAALNETAGELNTNEQALGEWVEHFNTTLGAIASQSSSLKAAVAQLPGAVHSLTRGFTALHRSEKPFASFANALTPGVAETASTVAAALPWISQFDALLKPDELGGVATSLSEASPQLAGLIGGQQQLFAQTDEFSKCLTKVFYPAGETKLQDGAATTGADAYKEFFYMLTGFASVGQNFDGNGAFSRFLAGGGGHTLISGATSLVGVKGTGSKLIARATLSPEGTRPRFPEKEPPYKPLVPCSTQTVPNLNGPLAQGPADGAGG